MNSLYREVFRNKFIKTTIYSFYSQLRAGKFAQKYDDIVRLDWIINNNHWSLLKDKVDRDCFLLLANDTKNVIFKIKDHRIFVKLFEQFKHYFIVAYPPVLQAAAKENNLEALKYLVQHGYTGKQDECYKYAWEHKNTEMLVFLLDTFTELDVVKRITSNLELAIKHSNEDVIRYLSKLPRFSEFYLQSLEQICASPDIGMFKLAEQLLGDRIELDEHMLSASISNFELFKYLVDKYPSSITSTMYNTTIAHETVSKKAYNVFLFLNERNLISSVTYQDLRDIIAVEAYKDDNQEMYNTLKTDTCDLSSIKMLSDVKNFGANLDKVKELRSIGVFATEKCLRAAAVDPKHFAVFHLLWEKMEIDDRSQSLISEFVVTSIKNTNAPLYQYMIPLLEETQPLSLVYADWSHLVKNEQNINFFKTLVSTLIVSRFTKDIDQAFNDASKHGCLEIFKFLFSVNTKDPLSGIFTQSYKNAVLYEHRGILEFLVNQKIQHDNQILGKARSVETVEYLISKGHTFISSTFKDAIGADISVLEFLTSTFAAHQVMYKDHAYLLAITDAINQYRFQHFRHLVEISQTQTSKDILLAICKTDNLQLLEYYTSKFPFHPESFKQAMSYGNLNLVKHLLTNFKSKITINEPDFRSIVILKHVHIMEFLKDYINTKEGILTITPKDLLVYKGIDQIYNQYLEKFISTLNEKVIE